MALEESNNDFERNRIHINQASAVKKGEGVILKGMKTDRVSLLPLPLEVMNLIKKLLDIRRQETYKARNHRLWKDYLFLFSNEFGKPNLPDSISQ